MSSLPEEKYPDYVLGCVLGLVAALVLMPLHQLLVYSSGSGYYTYPAVAFITAALVGLTVRLGAKMGGDIPLAIIAGFITLLHIIGSEYLVARRILNLYFENEGFSALPLILPLGDMVDLMGTYLQDSWETIILVPFGIGMSAFIAMTKDLMWVPRYGLSGWPQPTIQPRPAAPVTSAVSTPAPTPISIAMPPPAVTNVPPSSVPAEAMSLGAPLRRHAVTGSGYTVTGVIMVVVALGLFALSMNRGMIEFGRTVLIGFGILLIALGLFRIVPALLTWGDQVVAYQHGLSITQRGKHRTMRWDEIDEVWQNQQKFSINLIPIVDTHQYTVVGVDGSRFVFDNTYRKIGDLGATIQEAVTRTQLPKAGQALSRGETLNFGPVDISQVGLTWNKHLYEWHDVIDVGVWQGSMRIRSKTVSALSQGGPPISKVPNVHLFFTLVYNILNRNPTGG